MSEVEQVVPVSSPAIGDFILYVDQFGVEHNALVTANWGGTANPHSSVNVVYVSADENKGDNYGRQIERETSVVPAHNQPAHGRFYRAL